MISTLEYTVLKLLKYMDWSSSMLYADPQVYLTQQEAIMKLNNCLTDIESWAQMNMLK